MEFNFKNLPIIEGSLLKQPARTTKKHLKSKDIWDAAGGTPIFLRSTVLALASIINRFPITKSWVGNVGFQNFLKDMGERPEGSILVRINNNKIFCKSNCKWINWREYALLNSKIPVSRFTHCRLIRLEIQDEQSRQPVTK